MLARKLTTTSATPEGTIQYRYSTLYQHIDTWTGTGADTAATTWTHYDYDTLGRLRTVTQKRLNGSEVNLITSYAYDASGNLAHELLPNGVTTDYIYDTLNRLTNEVQKNPSGTTLYSVTYLPRADGSPRRSCRARRAG